MEEMAALTLDCPEEVYVAFLFPGDTAPTARVSALQDLSTEERQSLHHCLADQGEIYDEDNPADVQEDVPLRLTKAQEAKRDSILANAADMFADTTHFTDSAGREAGADMPIRLRDENVTPRRRNPRRLSPADFLELQKQLETLLKADMIELSDSPFGAPVLFVPKKDGKRRFAIDYRELNDNTIKDVTPLPRIDDMIQRLEGATVFSKLDATWMFWQLRLREEDRFKTGMSTPLGHFHWKVVPFGLTNAPGHAMRVMSKVLQPFLNRCAMVMIDDIIVYSKTVEEHMEHLEKIFAALRKHKIFMKRAKCDFFLERLKYLGFVVSGSGMGPSRDILDAIKKYPEPTTVTEVRGFLGLCNYYSKLIRNYSGIAAPLSDAIKGNATKGSPVELSDAQRDTFLLLKHTMCTSPVLNLVNPNKGFVLQTDASAYAIGAVLMQESGNRDELGEPILHAVGYFSKKLSEQQQKYHTTARELLGIVEALRYWKIELQHAHSLTVHCDHRPLSYLRTVEPLGDMHARWLQTIESFQFDVVHRPGVTLGPADALSRRADHADSETGGAITKGRAVPLPEEPDFIDSNLEPGQRCKFDSLPNATVSWTANTLRTWSDIEAGSDVTAHLSPLDVSLVVAVTTRRSARQAAGGNEAPVKNTEPKSHQDTPSPALATSPTTTPATLSPSHEDMTNFCKAARTAAEDPSSPDLTPVSNRLAEATREAHSSLLQQVKRATATDELALRVGRQDPQITPGFTLRDGLLYKDILGLRKVFIPADPPTLRTRVLALHHDFHAAGHMGYKKTLERLSRAFWWPGFGAETKRYVRSCPTCQRTKRSTQQPLGNPSPFPAPHERWEVVTMDELGGLPTTPRGNSKIWIFVCKLTKRLVAVPMRDGNDTMDVAWAFVRHVIQDHGLPRKLVSDRDPRLASAVWQEVTRLWNIRGNISTANSPQTDGQSESAVEAITQLLRAGVSYNGQDWDLLLPSAVFAYNDSCHPATGYSPFFLDTGRHPQTPAGLLARDLGIEHLPGIRERSAAEFVRKVNDTLLQARTRIGIEQQRLAAQMRKRVRPHELNVGDLVMLSWKAAGETGRPMGKLRPQWLGPFPITARKYDNAYELQLPANMRIHRVVNARFLKKFEARELSSTLPAADEHPLITQATDFKIELEADGWHRAFVRVDTIPSRVETDGWMPVTTVADMGGFWAMAEMLRTLPELRRSANNFLGSMVHDSSFSQGAFWGTVSAFDPLETDRAYEVSYEDGDSRWISLTKLKPLLAAGKRRTLPQRANAPPVAALRLTPPSVSSTIRALVLFSGTNSVGLALASEARTQGLVISVVNIDSDPAAPDAVHLDVLQWDYRDLPRNTFNLIWASPPCTEYSAAKTTAARDLLSADKLVKQTRDIIAYFRPSTWIIENPQGLLTTRPVMTDIGHLRVTASYCRYGTPYRKNTHFWTNVTMAAPLRCTNETPCPAWQHHRCHHMRAQRGPGNFQPGVKNVHVLHAIPKALLAHLLQPALLQTANT
jgi:hypothetical protein